MSNGKLTAKMNKIEIDGLGKCRIYHEKIKTMFAGRAQKYEMAAFGWTG